MKNILTIILVAMFCLGSVEAMAQDRTITRQSTPQPVRPTKEQQYQKDLKAGEKLFDQEKYADAKGIKKMIVDGKEIEGNLIPIEDGKKVYNITAIM